MANAGSALGTTVADRTADILRQRILDRMPGYLPGERLFPLALAEELGVSATPVQRALERLAADGLVENVPRRGTYVAQLASDDLDDLASVRAGLELLAFRFRGGQLTTAELAELGAALDRGEAAISAGDHDGYRDSEFEFHRLLVSVGRSPRLLTLYETLLNQTRIIAVYIPRVPEHMRDSLAEHRRLLEVLEGRDLATSEHALVAHWDRTRDRIRRQFGKHLRTDQINENGVVRST